MEQAVSPAVGMPVAIITAALFFAVASAVIAYLAFRQRIQIKALETLRSALDTGSELTPALASVLEVRSDLRRGVISLTRALACIVLGLAIQIGASQPEDAGDAQAAMWFLFGLSAFPGLFGLALIGFHVASARRSR